MPARGRSPSPMEARNVSDDESPGPSRNSSRSRSPTPMSRVERRLRSENEALKKANEAQEQRIKDLQEQVRAMARQLLDQAEEANRRHEELLRRLPVQEAQEAQKPQQKGKRKKQMASGESGSEEEPAKLPRTKEAPSPAPIAATTTAEKTAAPTTEETTAPKTDKNPKIPPVILRKKEKWTKVSGQMKEGKVNFTRAKLTGEGIAITPASAHDHRLLTKMLNQAGEEYHTYSLQEEKKLRAVIRGIPSGIPIAEITDDLRDQGYAPTEVYRMTSRKTKQEMPLILVKVPQEQASILELRRCCSLVVKVENQRVTQETTKYHRGNLRGTIRKYLRGILRGRVRKYGTRNVRGGALRPQARTPRGTVRKYHRGDLRGTIRKYLRGIPYYTGWTEDRTTQTEPSQK